MNDITYVGLDVHKATVCVAIAESGRGGEVREVGIFENRPDVLRKMVARLGKQRHRLNFCYEAGPCGYGLHRLLTGLGHDCVVVAPSLIPMKAGDRVKTDRRDALMLARLHRAGELTPRPRCERCRRRGNICRAFCCPTTGFATGLAPGPWHIDAGSPRCALIIRRSRSCCRTISILSRMPNADATG